MSNTDIEKNIKVLYSGFLKKHKINAKSGVLNDKKELKFATYPYIGSKYYSGRAGRILFIGLDIGRDESTGILQFREKRVVVEGMNSALKKMNPHIAGLYVSTLFLSKETFGKFKDARSYKAAIRKFQETSNINPLSYVALTNLFKFVTVGRIKRSGSKDRQHIFKKEEENLLLNEVKILKPHVIVLESLSFKKNVYKEFLKRLANQNKNVRVFIAPHPSYHGSQVPRTYINQFEKIQ